MGVKEEQLADYVRVNVADPRADLTDMTTRARAVGDDLVGRVVGGTDEPLLQSRRTVSEGA